MRKGSKKIVPEVYKGPDYEKNKDGVFVTVPESKEYYGVRDLVIEAKQILKQYGFKLSDLLSVKTGKTDFEMRTFSQKWGETNLYRYFNEKDETVTMQNDVLSELCFYMRKLSAKIDEKEKRGKYGFAIDILEDKIERYLNESIYPGERMAIYLGKMGSDALVKFLQSIYILEIPMEAWYFWLCYSTLSQDERLHIDNVLQDCAGSLPICNALLNFFSFKSEDYIIIQHKMLTALEKSEEDKTKREKALFEIALSYCQNHIDKEQTLEKICDICRFNITVDRHDWLVLMMKSMPLLYWYSRHGDWCVRGCNGL